MYWWWWKLSIVSNWFPGIEFGYFSCSVYLVTKIFQNIIFIFQSKIWTQYHDTKSDEINLQFATKSDTELIFAFSVAHFRGMSRGWKMGRIKGRWIKAAERGAYVSLRILAELKVRISKILSHFGWNLLIFPEDLIFGKIPSYFHTASNSKLSPGMLSDIGRGPLWGQMCPKLIYQYVFLKIFDAHQAPFILFPNCSEFQQMRAFGTLFLSSFTSQCR